MEDLLSSSWASKVMLWSPRLSLSNFHVKLTAKGLFRNLQLLPGCKKSTVVFHAGWRASLLPSSISQSLPSSLSHHTPLPPSHISLFNTRLSIVTVVPSVIWGACGSLHHCFFLQKMLTKNRVCLCACVCNVVKGPVAWSLVEWCLCQWAPCAVPQIETSCCVFNGLICALPAFWHSYVNSVFM